MKLTADYTRRSINENGEVELTFTLADFGAIKASQTLDKKRYTLDLKEYKSSRSLEQNRLIWALIGEIDKKINGYATSKDSHLDIYCQIITMAKIRVEYIETLERAKESLDKVFRVVKEVERRTSNKGVETVLYQCFYGTSTFDVKEMSDFIESLLHYAQQCEVSLSGYDGLYS